MNKVYVNGNAKYYASWLPLKLVDTIEEADLVMFTGGEDVNPALYGENPHYTTSFSTYRDDQDIKCFNRAVELGKPMLGICRGSQFLTVMNGGKLIQNVTNHGIGGGHTITDNIGTTFTITSTHHQMHFPFEMEKGLYSIVAWSSTKRSDKYEGEGGAIELPKDFVESEIIYFPQTRSLGIQGHPEHYDFNHPTNKYLRELVKDYLYGNEPVEINRMQYAAQELNK